MNSNTYILILIDTLKKKNQLLDSLTVLTQSQEDSLNQISLDDSLSYDLQEFEEKLLDKQTLIDNLNQLDDGFEKLYERVKDDVNSKKMELKDAIIELQELIKLITEKGAQIQIKEKHIKAKLETHIYKKKKEIKEFKVNNQTASNYYKNMANSYQGESYFLDKKN